MKFTEGAFRTWGYELAQKEFPNETLTEAEFDRQPDDQHSLTKVIIKDRIADMMFQQVLLRPAEYSVIATGNLERGLSFRCPGGPGWGPGHGPGGQPG